MNYFDLIVILILFISFYGGYKNGLIKSIFSTIGYIAGGVLGLAAAVNYLSTWQSELQKVGLALLAILFGATLGEFLLGKIGSLFRKVLFVPPFKFIDSLLGAGLSLARSAFVLYLVSTLLVVSSWSVADDYIKPSRIYTYTDSHLPSVMKEIRAEIDDLLQKVN
ncbi:MAG: CvpA family protein [Candidatus Nanopelagicus sp.]